MRAGLCSGVEQHGWLTTCICSAHHADKGHKWTGVLAERTALPCHYPPATVSRKIMRRSHCASVMVSVLYPVTRSNTARTMLMA